MNILIAKLAGERGGGCRVGRERGVSDEGGGGCIGGEKWLPETGRTGGPLRNEKAAEGVSVWTPTSCIL